MEQHLEKLFESSTSTIKLTGWRRAGVIKQLLTLPVQWDLLVKVDVLAASAIIGDYQLEVEFTDEKYFDIKITDDSISFMPS